MYAAGWFNINLPHLLSRKALAPPLVLLWEDQTIPSYRPLVLATPMKMVAMSPWSKSITTPRSFDPSLHSPGFVFYTKQNRCGDSG